MAGLFGESAIARKYSGRGRVALGLALVVRLGRAAVAVGEPGVQLGEVAAGRLHGVHHGLEAVLVLPAGRAVGATPHVPDQLGHPALRRAVLLGQEAEEDPVPVVVPVAVPPVELEVGSAELPGGEVVHVVVDGVVDLVLGPGGRRLHEPRVLVGVVGVLGGVEVLVRGRDLHVLQRGVRRELAVGVVVVEHAVRLEVPRAAAGGAALGGAVRRRTPCRRSGRGRCRAWRCRRPCRRTRVPGSRPRRRSRARGPSRRARTRRSPGRRSRGWCRRGSRSSLASGPASP